MTRELVNTKNAPGAIGPYSQGVKVGNLIFTSGQIPVNPANGEIAKEIKAATKQSLENVKAILECAGTTLDKVVKCVIFLKDMNDFAAVNEVYGEYFSEILPARSCVQVAKLPLDVLVEIEAIAELA